MDETVSNELPALPIKPLSLGSELVQQLGRAIVAGEYEQGDLIEDEATLAKRFSVSRTVVRDAIKVLVGKNLLEVRQGVGTRVKLREQWGLLDGDVLTWQLSAPTYSQTLLQLAEARQLFQPQAAAWAAERATGEEVDKIRQAVGAMKKTVVDSKQFSLADASFHCSVVRAAHNEFLLAFVGVSHSAFLRSLYPSSATIEEKKLSLPMHQDVYLAIKRQDSNDAKFRMNLLVENSLFRLKSMCAGA